MQLQDRLRPAQHELRESKVRKWAPPCCRISGLQTNIPPFHFPGKQPTFPPVQSRPSLDHNAQSTAAEMYIPPSCSLFQLALEAIVLQLPPPPPWNLAAVVSAKGPHLSNGKTKPPVPHSFGGMNPRVAPQTPKAQPDVSLFQPLPPLWIPHENTLAVVLPIGKSHIPSGHGSSDGTMWLCCISMCPYMPWYFPSTRRTSSYFAECR